MIHQRFLWISLFLLAFVHPAGAQNAGQKVTAFLTDLAQGRPAMAYEQADSNLQAKVKPEQLTMVWQQLEGKFGKWNGLTVRSVSRQDANQIVLADGDFERSVVGFKVVLNAAEKVSGFTVVQVTPKTDTATRVPDGVVEQAVAIPVNGGIIQATLTLPVASRSPGVALIIAGSGPTDRNGNNTLGVTAQSYRLLAYAMAVQGMASLRYDKRMIGASTGFQQRPQDVSLDDFVNDAVACLKTLKADKRFAGVYVVGHSEGALVGMLAAAREPVSGCVSLCGMTKPMDEILKSQIRVMNPELYDETVKLLAALKAGNALPQVPAGLTMIFNPSTTTFLRSMIPYDPAAVINTVKAPFFIVAGSRDLQIAEADNALLTRARPDARFVLVAGMNHILKQSPPDVPGNLKTYQDPALPVDDSLVRTLVQFMLAK